jgi:hypothetical protein
VAKVPKGIAASSGENNCVGSGETHHVSSRPEKDRRGTAEKVGAGTGGKEGGVRYDTRMKPAASVGGFSL